MMHAFPLKHGRFGERVATHSTFLSRNTLGCARHFHRIGHVNASTGRGENEKSRQRDARAGRISMSNSFISRRTSHGNPGFRSRFVSSLFPMVIFRFQRYIVSIPFPLSLSRCFQTSFLLLSFYILYQGLFRSIG